MIALPSDKQSVLESHLLSRPSLHKAKMNSPSYYHNIQRAQQAADEEKFRDAAEEYWAGFLLIREKYNGDRYNMFKHYTDLCKGPLISLANENDIANMQGVLEDKHEPRLFRVVAGFALAFILNLQNEDRTKCDDIMDYASLIAKRRPKERIAAKEDGCMISWSDGDEEHVKTMTELIQQAFTVGLPSSPYKYQPIIPLVQMDILIERDDHILSRDELGKLLVPGGVKCDYCKCVDKELSRCSTCNSVWFCGRECQEKQWFERNHKKYCRKKGQYKPGDLVQITRLQDQEHTIVRFGCRFPLKNGEVARIICRDTSSNEEKYIVRLNGIMVNGIPFNPYNECWETSLKPDNICHLRPYDCRI
jgi:hypothetical protein